MYIGLRVNYPLHLSDFLRRFSRSTKILVIHSMRAEMFKEGRQRDGEADMTELSVVLCNFANAPKNGPISLTFYQTGNREQLNEF
jgi:hypothetical protein